MTDRDIGPLWENLYRARLAGQQSAYIFDVIELIRKLVKERAQSIATLTVVTERFGAPEPSEAQRQSALSDFGIDPTTWSEK